MKVKIGVLTLSDRAHKGIYDDISGKAIADALNEYLTTEWEPVYKVLPADRYGGQPRLFACRYDRGNRPCQTGCYTRSDRSGL